MNKILWFRRFFFCVFVIRRPQKPFNINANMKQSHGKWVILLSRVEHCHPTESNEFIHVLRNLFCIPPFALSSFLEFQRRRRRSKNKKAAAAVKSKDLNFVFPTNIKTKWFNVKFKFRHFNADDRISYIFRPILGLSSIQGNQSMCLTCLQIAKLNFVFLYQDRYLRNETTHRPHQSNQIPLIALFFWQSTTKCLTILFSTKRTECLVLKSMFSNE